MKYQSAYPIGYQFRHHGKRHEGIRTIMDVHTKTNAYGEVIRTVYVTAHDCGNQYVFDYEVPLAAIARSEPVEPIGDVSTWPTWPCTSCGKTITPQASQTWYRCMECAMSGKRDEQMYNA